MRCHDTDQKLVHEESDCSQCCRSSRHVAAIYLIRSTVSQSIMHICGRWVGLTNPHAQLMFVQLTERMLSSAVSAGVLGSVIIVGLKQRRQQKVRLDFKNRYVTILTSTVSFMQIWVLLCLPLCFYANFFTSIWLIRTSFLTKDYSIIFYLCVTKLYV